MCLDDPSSAVKTVTSYLFFLGSFELLSSNTDKLILVYACLDTCCNHSLTIVAGVDLHFKHESELPVCRSWGLNLGGHGARRGC